MRAELLELAKENSSERRRELLGRIADELLDVSAEYSDHEVVMFCEVLTSLLDQVGIEARAEFAETIAASDRATKSLHLRLAEDDIEVAAPILMQSTKLDDDDLVGLVSSQTEGHRLAVSRRENLSFSVTDALVECGEPAVLVSLTENFGAEISETSFATLAQRAAASEDLRTALSFRSDMPVATARQLMRMLPESARQRLTTLMRTSHSTARRVMRSATEEYRARRTERQRERREVRGMVAEVRAGNESLDKVISELAEAHRLLDVALVISEFTALGENVMNQMLLRDRPMPLALVLKSLGASATTVDAVGRAWCRRLGLSDQARQKLMSAWQEMDPETAGRAMRFTKVRAALTAA